MIDLEDALSDRVVIHGDIGTNKSYTWVLKVEGEEGGIDAAFDAATFTVKERYVQQRLIPMAMEPRAVAAVPQPFGGDITLYSATQIPHILKLMTAVTLGIPEHQVRVVAPAVGGGFGSKLNVYAEELLCMALARKHGAPVRWNESRSENSQATIQGRGQIQDIELAAGDGVVGLRLDGHREDDFVRVLAHVARQGAEVQRNLRVLRLGRQERSLRRFEGQVLDVDRLQRHRRALPVGRGVTRARGHGVLFSHRHSFVCIS